MKREEVEKKVRLAFSCGYSTIDGIMALYDCISHEPSRDIGLTCNHCSKSASFSAAPEGWQSRYDPPDHYWLCPSCAGATVTTNSRDAAVLTVPVSVGSEEKAWEEAKAATYRNAARGESSGHASWEDVKAERSCAAAVVARLKADSAAGDVWWKAIVDAANKDRDALAAMVKRLESLLERAHANITHEMKHASSHVLAVEIREALKRIEAGGGSAMGVHRSEPEAPPMAPPPALDSIAQNKPPPE